MKVLPLDAGEDEIRALVLEWNEFEWLNGNLSVEEGG